MRHSYLFLRLLPLLLLSGCTTWFQQQVTLQHQAVAGIGGGNGEIVIVYGLPDEKPQGPWIVGTTKNRDGERMEDLVLGEAPSKLLAEALASELTSAGFAPRLVNTLPEQTSRAIRLTKAKLDLSQQTELLRLNASSRIIVAGELWHDGKAISKIEYESSYSDFATTNRELLLTFTLQQAMNSLMKKALPEIMIALGTTPVVQKQALPAATTPATLESSSSPAVPSSPVGLALLPAPHGYYLVWQQGSVAATSYEIYRAAGNSPFAPIATLPGGRFQYHDAEAKEGTTYRYTIRALTPTGPSPLSAEVVTGR
jgi:hypothetical protein